MGILKKGILIRILRSSEKAKHTVSVPPLIHISGRIQGGIYNKG